MSPWNSPKRYLIVSGILGGAVLGLTLPLMSCSSHCTPTVLIQGQQVRHLLIAFPILQGVGWLSLKLGRLKFLAKGCSLALFAMTVWVLLAVYQWPLATYLMPAP